jgi:hypothetical protein
MMYAPRDGTPIIALCQPCPVEPDEEYPMIEVIWWGVEEATWCGAGGILADYDSPWLGWIKIPAIPKGLFALLADAEKRRLANDKRNSTDKA